MMPGKREAITDCALDINASDSQLSPCLGDDFVGKLSWQCADEAFERQLGPSQFDALAKALACIGMEQKLDDDLFPVAKTGQRTTSGTRMKLCYSFVFRNNNIPYDFKYSGIRHCCFPMFEVMMPASLAPRKRVARSFIHGVFISRICDRSGMLGDPMAWDQVGLRPDEESGTEPLIIGKTGRGL